MGYSEKANMVRVDFFSSGRWYTTEAVEWNEELWSSHTLIHDAFRQVLDKHLNNSTRLTGMTAICLEPYHEYSHPVMVIV